MAKKDAEITVGADASEVEKAFARAKSSVREQASEMASSMADAARGVVGSFTEIATAQSKVNFAGQFAQVRQFEASSARLAVAMGRDLEGVRSSLEATGKSIGKRPEEVAAWTSEVGKLTYNFAGAAEAIKGVSALASETGRSIEDYRGLAAELGTVGHVAGDTSNAIGVITAQSEKLGLQGGVAAFADQITGLQDTISHFASTSEQDFLKITALAAELGKGLSPQAAGRVQQGAFGAIQSDPLRWERYLGHKIGNKFGQVEDPAKVMQEITEKTKKRYGKGAERVMQLNFGYETGTAMFNANYEEAASAAGFAPSKKPGAAQAAYLKTDAGRREVADAQLAESSRNLMGSSTLLGRAADGLQRFAAANPFTSTMGSNIIGAAVKFNVDSTMKLMKGLMEGGSKGSIATTMGAAGMSVSSGISIAAAGAIGYAIGDALDKQFHWSDKIANALHGGSIQDKENASYNMTAEIQKRSRASMTGSAAVRGAKLNAVDVHNAQEAVNSLVMKNPEMAKGGEKFETALKEILLNKEYDQKAAAVIAKAVADSISKVKIVSTGQGVGEVALTGSESSAAGGQGN